MDLRIFVVLIVITALLAICYSLTCAIFVQMIRDIAHHFIDTFPRKSSFKEHVIELLHIARSVYLYNFLSLILGVGLYQYFPVFAGAFLTLIIIPIVKFWRMQKAYTKSVSLGNQSNL